MQYIYVLATKANNSTDDTDGADYDANNTGDNALAHAATDDNAHDVHDPAIAEEDTNDIAVLVAHDAGWADSADIALAWG